MNKEKIEKFIIHLIWGFILFVTIYDLFYVPVRSIFWAIEFILAIFIYYKLKIPKEAYIGVLFLFLLNIFGELFFGFFYTIKNFDKWLHLLSPLVSCTLFYFIAKRKIKNKRLLILFSVTILLSWELAWESIEYFFDQKFHTFLAGVQLVGFENFKYAEVMPKYEDTIFDMFYNLIGSVIWATIALFVTRKKHNKS